MDPFSQLILAIAVTSFLAFQWLFHKCSPWVSTRLSSGFCDLREKQKVEWNSRTVSTFHALVVGLFCVFIFIFDDAVNKDPVWGDPTLVKVNVGITTGYLISDLLLIFYYWKDIGDKFFVVHHFAALYAYYYVLVSALLSNSRTCSQDGKEQPWVNSSALWFWSEDSWPLCYQGMNLLLLPGLIFLESVFGLNGLERCNYCICLPSYALMFCCFYSKYWIS